MNVDRSTSEETSGSSATPTSTDSETDKRGDNPAPSAESPKDSTEEEIELLEVEPKKRKEKATKDKRNKGKSKIIEEEEEETDEAEGHGNFDVAVGEEINVQDWARDAALNKSRQRRGLRLGPPSQTAEIRFENVFYSVEIPLPIPKWEWSKPSTWWARCYRLALAQIPFVPPPKMKREILHGIAGHVQPGKMLAIMGPTGSGKTTLLNVLAGRVKRNVRGTILLNGERLKSTKHNNTAYVLQDDIFFHNLTVRETLKYTAHLKLPREMPIKEKNERVQRVLEELDIAHCADTIVGNQFMRGVSGGERKRTNIGNELVSDPSLMFLDEPTTGLDSTTAYNLVLTLKALAESGRTIVTTIHQPSSQMFELFDDIILLVGGHIMYHGKAADVLGYFEELGFRCMAHYNPADFMLDLAVTGTKQKMRNSDQTVTEYLIDAYARSHPIDETTAKNRKSVVLRKAASAAGKVKSTVAHQKHAFAESKERRKWKKQRNAERRRKRREERQRRRKPSRRSERDKKNAKTDEDDDDDGEASTISGVQETYPFWRYRKWQTGFLFQLWTLFLRAIRQRKGDSITPLHFGQVIVISVIAGLLWFDVGGDTSFTGVSDRVGFIFFSSLFWALHTWFGALTSFPPERGVVTKERLAGTYRLSAYVIAKSLADTLIDWLFPILFVSITYFMVGLNGDPDRFFVYLALILLLNFLGGSFGLLIGTVILNPKAAVVMSSVLILTCTLLAGFFINNYPSWLNWLQYASFSKYGLEALLTNDLEDIDDTFEDEDGDKKSGEEILDELGTDTELWWASLALVGFAIAPRVLAYFALRYLNRPVR